MATRQAPHTEAVLDNSMLNEFPSDGDSKVVHALPKDQFDSIIRNVKKRSVDVAQSLLALTSTTLGALKVQRDLDEAVSGIPDGSDHWDFGTFIVWAGKIKADDECSIEQLVAIDATAQIRVSG